MQEISIDENIFLGGALNGHVGTDQSRKFRSGAYSSLAF